MDVSDLLLDFLPEVDFNLTTEVVQLISFIFEVTDEQLWQREPAC